MGRGDGEGQGCGEVGADVEVLSTGIHSAADPVTVVPSLLTGVRYAGEASPSEIPPTVRAVQLSKARRARPAAAAHSAGRLDSEPTTRAASRRRPSRHGRPCLTVIRGDGACAGRARGRAEGTDMKKPPPAPTSNWLNSRSIDYCGYRARRQGSTTRSEKVEQEDLPGSDLSTHPGVARVDTYPPRSSQATGGPGGERRPAAVLSCRRCRRTTGHRMGYLAL